MFIKTKIKKWIRKNFPYISYKLYVLHSLLNNIDGREHYLRKGKGQTIYIIRPRTNGIEGLMSLFLYVIERLEYAEKRGMIPVIDMKNYYTQYANGIDNVWEWYFKQPAGLELNEAYKSNSVLLSGYKWKEFSCDAIEKYSCIFSKELNEYWNKIFKKYIFFSDEVNELLEQQVEKINPSECIGVYARGTDYVTLQPPGEPRQPTHEMFINKIDEFLEKYDVDNIFLVTEDQINYDVLKSKYGQKLLVCDFDSFISGYEGKDYLSKSNVLNIDKHQLGMNYLLKILLLASCKYFIGGITRGSIAASIINGHCYTEEYFFDLGRY